MPIKKYNYDIKKIKEVYNSTGNRRLRGTAKILDYSYNPMRAWIYRHYDPEMNFIPKKKWFELKGGV